MTWFFGELNSVHKYYVENNVLCIICDEVLNQWLRREMMLHESYVTHIKEVKISDMIVSPLFHSLQKIPFSWII